MDFKRADRLFVGSCNVADVVWRDHLVALIPTRANSTVVGRTRDGVVGTEPTSESECQVF